MLDQLKIRGSDLAYANDELKSDREIVLTAVKNEVKFDFINDEAVYFSATVLFRLVLQLITPGEATKRAD